MSSLSEDNIQQQIEAKRKRLEELKQKRLQRQQKQEEPTATSTTTAPSASSPSSAAQPQPVSSSPSPRPQSAGLSSSHSLNVLSSSSNASSPRSATSSDDLLNVVNSLITSSPSPLPPPSTAPLTPIPTPTPAPRPKPLLTPQFQPSITIPSVDRVHYDAGTQTSESYLVEQSTAEERKGGSARTPSPVKGRKKGAKGAGAGWEEEEEDEVRKERDVLRHRETELMTTIREMRGELERRRVEEEEARRPRLLSAVESDELTRSADFVQFFARSSLMMERALAERDRKGGRYDYTIDYADDDVDDEQPSLVDTLLHRLSFDDPSKSARRPVSALDWSHKYPELMLAAYAATDEDDAYPSSLVSSTSASAQGCVLLWNLHLTSRPEYHFTSDSSILTAFFHPTQPRLIIGASASGQLLMWDTRSKSTPVNRTSLSNSHSYPIYCARQHGGQTVSISSDGYVCHWLDEQWHSPVTSFHLKEKGSELSVSAMDIHQGLMYVASDDGHVYKCRTHGEGDHIVETIKAHDAPITSLSFQPSSATASSPSASSLYLTSSYDWTVKLFAHHTRSPLASFESSRDYAYDAQWHPTHPGLFVTGDSTGKMDLWRLGAKVTGGGGGGGPDSGGGGEAGEGLTAKGWEVPQYTTVVGEGAGQQSKAGGEGTGGEGGVGAVEGGRVSALSKLKWHGDGSVLSVGTSHGVVSVWELNKEVAESSREEQERLWDFVTKQIANAR